MTFLRRTMSSREDQPQLLLLLILLLAFALRIWAVDFGLPYGYHADESALIRRTVGFGTGDLNPHSYHWPSFHLYVLFGLYGLIYLFGRAFGVFHSSTDYARLYFSDPTLFYLAGRLVSVVLGTATVYLTFRAGRRLQNPRAGLYAALCLTLTYYHVRDSHLATLDIPATFWVSVCFLLAVVLFRADRPAFRLYVVAGVAAGLATGTKYNAGVVFLALSAAHFLRESRAPFLYLMAAAASSAVAFLATNPFVVIDWSTFLRDFLFQQRHIAEGQVGIASLPAWAYYVQNMIFVRLKNSSRVLVDPLALLFLTGVASMAFYPRRREAVLVMIVPVAYLLYIGGWGMAATRYLDPAFPMLALAAGSFIDRAPRGGAAVALVLLCFSLRTIAFSNYILSQTDTRTEAKEWIEKNIPPNTRIAIETNSPPLRRSRENLERRARLLASGELHHPTQTPERIQQYYELRAEAAGQVAYDIERLNDNLLDTEAVRENRVPETNYDVARLKTLGVRYVIQTSDLRLYLEENPHARDLYPRIAQFYGDLESGGTLVHEFRPGAWRPGPVIRIFALTVQDRADEPGFRGGPS